MRKIMFSDRFGLTKAVIDRIKTQTRRIVPQNELERIDAYQVEYYNATFDKIEGAVLLESYFLDAHKDRLPYKIGDVVAIAQSYQKVVQCGYPIDSRFDAFRTANWGEGEEGALEKAAGWTNKMLVRAEIMPRQIRMTDVRFERLQDISDEDCLAEGIRRWTKDDELFKYDLSDGFEMFDWQHKPRTPREAYAALIDKLSGRGTWESNPCVVAYAFELEK